MVKRKLRKHAGEVTIEPDEGGLIKWPKGFSPFPFFFEKITLLCYGIWGCDW